MQMSEKAAEMNPGGQTVVGNLADAYRWAGQKDKANATYDKAIALAYKQLQVNPRDANTMGLMLLYAKKGDLTQAKEFIKRAQHRSVRCLWALHLGGRGHDCERTQAGDRGIADGSAKRIPDC